MHFVPLSRSFALCLVAVCLAALVAQARTDASFWPPSLSREGSSVWLGEPSLESWDYLRLRFRSPIRMQHSGGESLTGSVLLEATTLAHRPLQHVTLSDLRVVNLEFVQGGTADPAGRQAEIEAMLRDLRPTIPLADLADRFAGAKPLPSVAISSDVPRIFVSKKPAVVLQFDGPPMWLPVGESKISFAVNTNWDIFYDNKSTFYYLLAGDVWLATHDPFSSEWVLPRTLPKEFKTIPRNPDFANVWNNLPYEADSNAVAPVVFYSEGASELVLIEGEPQLESIGETGLAVVTNTRSNVFFEESTKRFFFLVAGRWFETADLTGYWRNVASLPAGFAAIPHDHPSAHVLAHVPGTPQSRREAFWATVPHLAKVQRQGTTVKVEFAGKPKLVPIDGTSLLWVPNATVPILAQGGDFFACHHGVWFHATDSKGPWEVADQLPADIYRIPSRSPAFHLSFVRLVASDEKTVTFGYTGGYENMFVHDGVVVYGTGFTHLPALQYGAYTYPIYFAQPSTFGVGSWYDPERHVFLRGRPGYGPFGGFGATSRFNSVTSHYFRAQTLYGDDRGEEPSLAFLPYTAAYGKLTVTYEPYAAWGDAVVNGGRSRARYPQTKPIPAVTIQVGQPQVGIPGGPLPKPETGFQHRKKR